MLKDFTVIEGNIGSGKTSLCKKIANEFKSNIILEEFEENPFLSDFLADQKVNPLGVELQFLIDRFHQLQSSHNSHKPIIADYFIEKSLVFSSNNLSEIEKKLFDRYYNVLFDKVIQPNLLVYLSVKPERLIDNIEKRGRKIEEQLTKEYLEDIHRSYMNYFKLRNDRPILVLEVSDLDFVGSEKDYQKIKETILTFNNQNLTEIKL